MIYSTSYKIPKGTRIATLSQFQDLTAYYNEYEWLEPSLLSATSNDDVTVSSAITSPDCRQPRGGTVYLVGAVGQQLAAPDGEVAILVRLAGPLVQVAVDVPQQPLLFLHHGQLVHVRRPRLACGQSP